MSLAIVIRVDILKMEDLSWVTQQSSNDGRESRVKWSCKDGDHRPRCSLPETSHSRAAGVYDLDIRDYLKPLLKFKFQVANFTAGRWSHAKRTADQPGGAIVSIAAPALKTALPDATIRLYTFGQMRTGNAEFAAHVEAKIGVEDIFRDGVPTISPAHFRYEHHATEFWQFEDPGLFKSPRVTVRRCLGREDPTYSDSILSTGINPAHARCFGRPFLSMSRKFSYRKKSKLDPLESGPFNLLNARSAVAAEHTQNQDQNSV
ncbi:hypothetical protein C8R44DRAFT_746458 [Mycena epipterygia]|nr:hypothetical protein C8R44DRAFT_746458 [Mycena epipterygia]